MFDIFLESDGTFESTWADEVLFELDLKNEADMLDISLNLLNGNILKMQSMPGFTR